MNKGTLERAITAAVVGFALLSGIAGAAEPAKGTSKLELSLYQIDWLHESDDDAFSDAFGEGTVSGALGGVIMFNGQPVVDPNPDSPLRFGQLKFFKMSSTVQKCMEKAATAATLQEIQANNPFGSPRATNFVVKLVGDIALNLGGNSVRNPDDLAVVEIKSLKTAACQVSTYIPY